MQGRESSGGIPREELAYALSREDLVRAARRNNRCLLCCSGPVNEAGLCEPCTIHLDDPELRQVERWRTGIGP